MKCAIVLLSLVGLTGPAVAENCTKSREYILEGLAGDLVGRAAMYQELFRVCTETLTLPNVKDAYVLRDGGIAVVPKRDTMIATAETLAKFCERFPRNTARFINPREQSKRPTVGLVVLMSSTGSTSCKKIRGIAES
jgi:hypothetical protein